jgi:hypothetical protein
MVNKNIQNLQRENDNAVKSFNNKKEELNMKNVTVKFLSKFEAEVLGQDMKFRKGDEVDMKLREDGDVQFVLGDEVFFFTPGEDVKVLESADDDKAEDNNNNKEENKMKEINVSIEKLEALNNGEVISLMREGIEFVNQETYEAVVSVIGSDRLLEVLESYVPEEKEVENKMEITSKEYVEKSEYKIELAEVGFMTNREAINLGLKGIKYLTPENLEDVVEVVGDKAHKLLPNPKKYVEYAKEGTPFCLIINNMHEKVGAVEWNFLSITEASEAKLDKFKALESIDGIDYLGKLKGKSSKKEWEVDFMVEVDGQISFFNSKFNVGKSRVRASVRKLRAIVADAQSRLMEAEASISEDDFDELEAEINKEAEVEETVNA